MGSLNAYEWRIRFDGLEGFLKSTLVSVANEVVLYGQNLNGSPLNLILHELPWCYTVCQRLELRPCLIIANLKPVFWSDGFITNYSHSEWKSDSEDRFESGPCSLGQTGSRFMCNQTEPKNARITSGLISHGKAQCCMQWTLPHFWHHDQQGESKPGPQIKSLAIFSHSDMCVELWSVFLFYCESSQPSSTAQKSHYPPSIHHDSHF